MSKKHIGVSVSLLLIFGMLVPNLNLTGAQPVGVCYGRVGNNLPSPQEVINLYRTNGITRMRIYDPDLGTLQALRKTNIELVLGVPDWDIQSLATNSSLATQWVQTNVRDFLPDVKFRYIAIGNEVDPNGVTAQYLLPAMENIYNAIAAVGLQDQIKVSTGTYTYLLGNSFPPSRGSFLANVRSFIEPIIGFLSNNSSPLLVNVYPYFSYAANPRDVSLSYALFTSPQVVVQDGALQYRNLFDAIVDAYYSALERANGANLEIVVSESGWPSDGGSAATIENASTYYRNLINHVTEGTPKRPGQTIETYLFSMFDGSEIEQHFGLFYPNKQSKHQLMYNRNSVMVMVCQ